MTIPAKQINYFLEARVGVSGFSSAGGASDTITSALTTALSTASRAGGSVPLQVGSANLEGVDTATGFNLTPIYIASGVRLTDTNGNDVYGKITNSGSTWTLSYFSAPSGAEAAYTMAASTSIAFEVPYIFSFADLPLTAITAVTDRHIAPDPANQGMRLQTDALTVTATNTVSALSRTQNGGVFFLYVNGVAYRNVGGSPPVSVSGTVVTWNATNAQFALATTDEVTAFYSY